MAEGDITLYNNAIEQILIGNIDFDADTFAVILLQSGYTFSADGNPGYTHVDSHEITSTGYTASGKNITTVTVTQRDSVDNVQVDFSDLTWSNLGSDVIRHAVCFDETATNDPLVFRMEISTNSNGGDYTIQWGTSGIIVASSA
jgi:hypothetical protein